MKIFENYLVKNEKAKLLSIEELKEIGYYYCKSEVEEKYFRTINYNKIIVLTKFKEFNTIIVSIFNISKVVDYNEIIHNHSISFHCNSLSDFKILLKLANI